jgi:hypothetical protein
MAMGRAMLGMYRILAALASLAALAAAAPEAMAQSSFLDTAELRSVGWSGFLDVAFILQSLSSLSLAIALGALIAFHPMTRRTVDTIEEAELPKIYIMYALIGALIGETVLRYGMVVGLVVFGIGGLMRFRTTTAGPRDTGRLIVVTLIGLISGLNLPHFAVLGALFAFALIYFFDAHPLCRLVVRRLPGKRFEPAVSAYRAALRDFECRLLLERQNARRERVEFVFRIPRRRAPSDLQLALERRVAEDLRGEIDLRIE